MKFIKNRKNHLVYLHLKMLKHKNQIVINWNLVSYRLIYCVMMCTDNWFVILPHNANNKFIKSLITESSKSYFLKIS